MEDSTFATLDMKKTLVLIRHAKSSWDYAVEDINRPLAPRGIDDAHKVAGELKRLNLNPDAIFTSNATRAKQTCDIISSSLSVLHLVTIINDLYDFSGERVLKVIRNLNPESNTVCIFGHNHAFTYLVNLLGDTFINNLPTCGVAILEFDSVWHNIQKGVTKELLFPKQL